jgi:dolichol-phosphate mannosyltransferase
VSSPLTLVIVPTFNERQNLPVLAGGLMQHRNVAMMIVDDASPDGTGDVADALAREHAGRIEVVHRTDRPGLGRSYIDGIRRAVTRPVEVIGQMDADLSHDPEELPRLFAAARDHDVVIGSRYVPGGSVARWSRWRRALSRAGNTYARIALGLPLRDATSGYRVYRRAALERLLVEPVRSDGYGFQIELALRASTSGLAIAEVPISFREREHGRSKISRRIVAEALWLVTVWGIRDRLGGWRTRERRNGRASLSA